MKNLNTIMLFTSLLILAACGKSGSSNVPGAAATSAASTVNAQEKYNSLNVPENQVSFYEIIGGQTYEKNSGNIFCRKTGATVPNPVFSYTCWQQSLTGNQAAQIFNSFPIQNRRSAFIGNIIGNGTVEVSNDSVFCNKVTASSPTAVPNYTCYQKM